MRKRAYTPVRVPLTRYVRDIDLAERYGISRATVWRWAQAGILPAPVKLGPATTRWDLEVIREAEAQWDGSWTLETQNKQPPLIGRRV